MRIAAGIVMIIGGLCLPAIYGSYYLEMTAKTMGVPIEVVIETARWTSLLVFLSLGLTVGGAISAFRRKYWWWALSGAICSVFIGFAMLIFPVPLFGSIFPPMAILAVIFLVKRKSEFE